MSKSSSGYLSSGPNSISSGFKRVAKKKVRRFDVSIKWGVGIIVILALIICVVLVTVVRKTPQKRYVQMELRQNCFGGRGVDYRASDGNDDGVHEFTWQMPIEVSGKEEVPEHDPAVKIETLLKTNALIAQTKLPKELSDGRKIHDEILFPGKPGADPVDLHMHMSRQVLDLGWGAMRQAVEKMVEMFWQYKHVPENGVQLMTGRADAEQLDGWPKQNMKLPKQPFEKYVSQEFIDAMKKDILQFLADFLAARKQFKRPSEAINIRIVINADIGQSCPKWHVDCNALRALRFYSGPGTRYAENEHVVRPVKKTGQCNSPDPDQEIDPKYVHEPSEGGTVYMKGPWLDKEHGGLAHRTPIFNQITSLPQDGVYGSYESPKVHDSKKYYRRLFVKIDDHDDNDPYQLDPPYWCLKDGKFKEGCGDDDCDDENCSSKE